MCVSGTRIILNKPSVSVLYRLKIYLVAKTLIILQSVMFNLVKVQPNSQAIYIIIC
jgi:hypothetical protein